MTTYAVNDIYLSIQGEGVLTGVPMVVLRLQGCGVGCPWCDTKQTWTLDPQNRCVGLQEALDQEEVWTYQSASEIAYKTLQLAQGAKWVLLTGGEPAEQELKALVHALHDAEFQVAIETSGTADGHMAASVDWVCVSPKYNMPGKRKLLPHVCSDADEIKMVIGKQSDVETLKGLLRTWNVKPNTIISLQPVSQSEKATKICVETALKMGWRVSIQIHKLLNLR